MNKRMTQVGAALAAALLCVVLTGASFAEDAPAAPATPPAAQNDEQPATEKAAPATQNDEQAPAEKTPAPASDEQAATETAPAAQNDEQATADTKQKNAKKDWMTKAAAPATNDDSDIRVAEVSICRKIESRTPVGTSEIFAPQVGELFCYTDVRDAGMGQRIFHRWYVGDELVSEIPMDVQGSRWRCWSVKSIAPQWNGPCHVEVVTESGEQIASATFSIDQTGMPASMEPDTMEPATEQPQETPSPDTTEPAPSGSDEDGASG